MGVAILCVSLACVLLYFPDEGGMLLPKGLRLNPQLVQPPKGYRGADSMNYASVGHLSAGAARPQYARPAALLASNGGAEKQYAAAAGAPIQGAPVGAAPARGPPAGVPAGAGAVAPESPSRGSSREWKRALSAEELQSALNGAADVSELSEADKLDELRAFAPHAATHQLRKALAYAAGDVNHAANAMGRFVPPPSPYRLKAKPKPPPTSPPSPYDWYKRKTTPGVDLL